MSEIISGHEAEMAALAEQAREPVEINSIRRILREHADLPMIGLQNLFGEVATQADVVRALRSLARAANVYADRIERQGCV